VCADVHKDGASGFFTENQFCDRLNGGERRGLPGAGTKQISDRLVIGCIRFAQKKRNVFLGISLIGKMALNPYDDDDPMPKDVMRCAAMARAARQSR
jgi:hypothetical protein